MAHVNVPTSRATLTAEDMQEAVNAVTLAQLREVCDLRHPILDGAMAVCPDCWMLREAGSVSDDVVALCRDAYSLRLVICRWPTKRPWIPVDAPMVPVEWAPFRKRGIQYEITVRSNT